VNQGWRNMFWSELIPALSFFSLLFFVPHSPRWLVMQNRHKEAKAVLIKITSSESMAEYELNSIRASIEGDKLSEKSSPFSKVFIPILIVGTILSVLQQVTGINAILYYGAEIFQNTLGYKEPLKQQILLGAVNLVFTFVAVFLVDKWGRKPLLIVGTLGMFLGIGTLGITIYLNQLGFISLIGMLAFVASFALSMGPVVWVLLSEIFPNKVRSAALSIAVAAQWLFNAIVGQTFPMIDGSELNKNTFNGALPYFIFAGFCVVTVIFVWKFIPETKGKSLEEMDSFWDKQQA
ncbi:MAG: SP family xylose:H+ symportor-like MFS transporter, partial [Bacteroidia bacterium]